MRRTLLLVSIVSSTLTALLLLIISLTLTVPAAAGSAVVLTAKTAKPATVAAGHAFLDKTSTNAAAMAEPMIQLRKNPLYYDAHRVSISQISSLLISQKEAWNRYRAGELDTIAPPQSALPIISGSPVYGPQLNVYPASSTNYVGFSTDIAPLDDPLLRAALASAIDRPRLVSDVLTGDEIPALTLTPPGSFGHVDGYSTGIGRPFAPALAFSLLQQSQYRNQPLTMTVNSGRLPQALSIQQMWSETLGINVTVNAMDWASYLNLLNNGTPSQRPHIFMAGWIADYPDADNFHNNIFVSGSNWPRYGSQAYSSAVLSAGAELNPNARLGWYEQAESLLVRDDTAIAPVYYGVGHQLTRPDLNRTYRGYGAQHFDEWFFDPGAERPLVMADASGPQTLDPALASNLGEVEYIEQLFLGLTDYDPATGGAVPELATTWQSSGDGLVYTFTLRSDALWTDGTPVTAMDVRNGVLRSLEPALGADHFPGSLLYIIRNAALYQAGQITDPAQVGVSALDATHVRFDLESAAAYFPIVAGLWPARPVPQHVIDLYGADWTRSDHIVTNGPYKLTSLNVNSADVGVVKFDWADPVPVNEPMTYTLLVYNNGPLTATSVSLQDFLPLGVRLVTETLSQDCSPDGGFYCFWPIMAPGDFASLSVTVIPNAIGQIYNQALVSATEFDDNTANNRAVEDTWVVDSVSTAPVLRSIAPRHGLNTTPTPIVITGMRFQPGIRPYLLRGNTLIPLLLTAFDNPQQIQSKVPAGLPLGSYGLKVVNPDGEEDVLPNAFFVISPAAPTIAAVHPSLGPNDRPVVIDIIGQNFAPDIKAYLTSGNSQGAALLATFPLDSLIYDSSSHLRAVVPRNTPAAVYGLTLVNPGGSFGQLPDAYKALDANTYEDLFAEAGNLWLRPPTLKLGETVSMGLVVHRRSPTNASPLNVRVSFYVGDPDSGGQFIGGSTALVPATGHMSSAPISWTPQELGGKLLCAKIDPLNNIVEASEENNLICRQVRVLPQLPDTTPPTVISFTVNNGERLTGEPWVSLDVVASDDSRLSRVLYVEYALNLGGFWDQVAVSEWLPYDTSTVDYPWRLYPAPGIHYFRACVADWAGNVGCAADLRPIAYLPDSSYLVDGEVHVYRRLLQPGTYEVQLTILSGGVADLYVWDTGWQQNGPVVVMTDVVSYQSQLFTVFSQGLHQLEIESTQGNVLYRLDVIPIASGLGRPTGALAPTNPLARFTPFVIPDDTPIEDESGLPSAPTGAEIFLPLILRQ